MKNIFKFRFHLLVFFFISLVLNASEKDKICPFELISFNAIETRDTIYNKLIINLEWKTASEMNTDKFIIEKDTLPVPVLSIPFFPEGEFTPIGELDAAGNTMEIRTYNFSDTSDLGRGNFLYRIKGVDKDGSFGYSEEIMIYNLTDVVEQISSNSLIESIFPNPTDGIFNILLNSNDLDYINMSLYDSKGTLLFNTSNKKSNSLINMDISEFPSGEYYINVSRGTSFEYKKIVILK